MQENNRITLKSQKLVIIKRINTEKYVINFTKKESKVAGYSRNIVTN